MTDTKIVKRGHGDYVVKCNDCGWREELKGSLAKAKDAVKVHVANHAEDERIEALLAGEEE